MGTWSAVVYGRTSVADRWWRALPAGVSTGHWVAEAVLDTVAAGAALVRYDQDPGGPEEYSPRYALARRADGTLVGVACRARALSSELCQDKFSREIYCFVGWFTTDPAARGLPPQADLLPVPGGWMSQVYEQYTRPVWTADAEALEIQESAAGQAPWSASLLQQQEEEGPPLGLLAGRPPAATGLLGATRAVRNQRVALYPAAMASQAWHEGGTSNGPFFLVTGWQMVRHAPLERIPHICADDVTEATVIDRPGQVEPELRPASASGRPAPPGDGTAERGGRAAELSADPEAARSSATGEAADARQERAGARPGLGRSYLHDGPLARDVNARMRKLQDRDPSGCLGWLARLLQWLQSESSAGPYPPRNPGSSHDDADQGSASPGPGPGDSEFPRRPGTSKPFEGLD
jgi:hypothetical protein